MSCNSLETSNNARKRERNRKKHGESEVDDALPRRRLHSRCVDEVIRQIEDDDIEPFRRSIQEVWIAVVGCTCRHRYGDIDTRACCWQPLDHGAEECEHQEVRSPTP